MYLVLPNTHDERPTIAPQLFWAFFALCSFRTRLDNGGGICLSDHLAENGRECSGGAAACRQLLPGLPEPNKGDLVSKTETETQQPGTRKGLGDMNTVQLSKQNSRHVRSITRRGSVRARWPFSKPKMTP